MRRRPLLALPLLATALAHPLGTARAQSSDKPLRLWVGFPPGGSADALARLLAEQLRGNLKRPVLVENKPGAGGRLAAEQLKNAAPDGDTLMLAPIVVPVMAPLVFSKLSYNPATDFAPVAHAATFHFGLAVPAEAPYRTLAELLAWFKANPKQANLGFPGAGSLPHFFSVMIGQEAGVDMVPVPYQGGAPLMTALLGNQVAGGIDVLAEFIPQHRAGKLRVLATSGAQRSKMLPDVPTFREAGLPKIQAQSWFALYAPARTPEPVIATLNAAVNQSLQSPALLAQLGPLALEAGGGSPADLVKLQEEETRRWGPVVKASGFKAD